MKKLYIIAILTTMSLAALAQDVLTVKAGGETTELQLTDEPTMTIGENVVVKAGTTTLSYSKDQRVVLISPKAKQEQEQEVLSNGLPYSFSWDWEEYEAMVKTYDSGVEYGEENEWNPNYNKIVGVPEDISGKKWYDTDYACNWEKQKAPFNNWCSNYGDIYVRRAFTFEDDLPTELYLACGHDDAPCEYYLNGELLWNVTDGWNENEVRKLKPSQIALLKKGQKNVLAFHVHQNWGGMYADGGLHTKGSTFGIAAGMDFVIDESSASLYGNESSSRIFDGKKETKWGFVPSGKDYVIFHPKGDLTANSYYFTTANDNAQYTGRNPKSWAIYGADAVNTAGDWPEAEAEAWQCIATVTDDNVMKDENFTTYNFPLDVQGNSFNYYKLVVYADQGAGFCQFSEFGVSSTVVEDPDGIKAVQASGSSISKYTKNCQILINRNGEIFNAIGIKLK